MNINKNNRNSLTNKKDYNDYKPVPAEGEEKQRILEKLRDISDGLGEYNIFAVQ